MGSGGVGVKFALKEKFSSVRHSVVCGCRLLLFIIYVVSPFFRPLLVDGSGSLGRQKTLHYAADSVTSAMSSLVKELKTGD